MKLKLSIQTIACAILCISLFSCKGKNTQGMGGFAREYAVMTLQPSEMEWFSNYPARIKGRQDIEIRPNVSGFLTELLVDEGSLVKKGDVLFVVDTIPYKAALKIAEANVEAAKASTETARLTAENKRELQKKGIISEYDLQMAENDYASAQAQLAQAEAQLVNARNNDSYTRVTSPLTGIVGSIPYRVGSLVSSATATPLTTVSDNSEMYVYFSMTEKQIMEMAHQYGANNFLSKLPAVSLKLADGTTYPIKGKIETVSGIIDTQTGSSSMRATFKNPDQKRQSSIDSAKSDIRNSRQEIRLCPERRLDRKIDGNNHRLDRQRERIYGSFGSERRRPYRYRRRQLAQRRNAYQSGRYTRTRPSSKQQIKTTSQI